MYTIEQTDYGIKLVFSGQIDAAEMGRWLNDVKVYLSRQSKRFSVFVDMRTMEPLPLDAQELIARGQMLAKRKGMQRSVVILDDAVTTMQFKRIALQTEIYNYERYVNASAVQNWEEIGMGWLLEARDPDKETSLPQPVYDGQ
jgi:hypothetical protein